METVSLRKSVVEKPTDGNRRPNQREDIPEENVGSHSRSLFKMRRAIKM
jgi:hypothetical protein